jgi:MFS family permease
LLRIFIYLFPVIINYILGGVFFISAQRFSESGAGAVLITGTMAMWALVYSFVSLLIGRVVNEKNAPGIIISGAVVLTLVSLAFVSLPRLGLVYLWVALTGVGSALYCTPFQVFMKSFERRGSSGGIVYATAMYTAAWSAGMAIGPFIFALLPWRLAFYLNAALSACLVLGVLLVQKLRPEPGQGAAGAPEPEPEPSASHPQTDYSAYPDYAWLGWIGAGLGSVTISFVRTLEPKLAFDLGIAKAHAGCILALVSLMQVLWALLLIRSRLWMYRAGLALWAGLAGLLGCLLFAFAKTLPLLYLAAVLYGSYSSFFFFTLVFFALVHSSKSSRYLSINEAVVGIAGISGAILGGLIAAFSSTNATFIFAALIILLATLHRYAAMRKNPAPLSLPKKTA